MSRLYMTVEELEAKRNRLPPLDTKGMRAFLHGYDRAINLARVYGGTAVGSAMARSMAMYDPFYNIARGWFREGAKMAIEVCERAWFEQNKPGGPYRS